MQTLQATTNPMFKIIEHTLFDRPKQYRVINEDAVMIAKVNGPHCVPIMQEILDAKNELDSIKRMCRERLVEIITSIQGTDVTRVTLRKAAENPRVFSELIKYLQDQLGYAPEETENVIGKEGVLMLNILK
jgi:hypothetical protein